MDTNPEDLLARSLGMRELTHFSRVPFGGGGACGALHMAALAVTGGAADFVLCYRALNERSGRRFGAGVQDRVPQPNAEAEQYGWSSPYGLLTPASWAGLAARRMMYEDGWTGEDFGRVTVGARAWAATNPRSRFHGRPLTLEEHQGSRWIAEPLRLLDCCLESDGAVAVLVTSAERARALRRPPVLISAAVQGAASVRHMNLSAFDGPGALTADHGVCARQLWAASGLAPHHIGVACLYDAFTPTVPPQLEAYDLCPPGGALEAVRAGACAPGARVAVNPHGGQLGEAYLHGMNNVVEAVEQVRGTAANQQPDVEHVLITGAALMPTSAAVLSAAP
jgi:acetyl-CoA acetyltransferase